jgi:uncharacterized protein with ACT and thioredoxin-like domain
MTARIAIFCLAFSLLGGCHQAAVSHTTGEHDIDGISRNMTGTTGGAIHDAPALSPPPVRPTFAQDR